MKLYVVDFETYYDKHYSLARMPMYEYVTDARYEMILLCWKELLTGERGVIRGDEAGINQRMKMFDGQAIVAHNAPFDAACMVWQHHAKPAKIYDTRAMARAWLGPRIHHCGVSLAALADFFGLPRKMGTVKDMLGVHVADMDPTQWEEYISYCQRDVDLCGEIFLRLLKEGYPKSELEVISLLNKMYVYPVLRLDKDRLEQAKNEIITKKANLVIASGVPAKELSSNVQFSRLFFEHTGVQINSASKTNPVIVKALKGGFGEKAKTLVEARLAVKSTIEQTRIERLLDLHERFDGRMPVPLTYYAAHTGRCGGMDKLNPQNFPRGGPIRDSIMAPDGHVLVVGDSSNIEARMLAWVARCNTLLEMFRQGRDVYREFASVAYSLPVEKITKEQRFVGKTCILGLGFGVGGRKLHSTLSLGGSDVSLSFAERLVRIYRNQFSEIPAFWSNLSNIIHVATTFSKDSYRFHRGIRKMWVAMHAGLYASIRPEYIAGPSQPGSMMRITLPNKMALQYFVREGARGAFASNPEAIVGGSVRRGGNNHAVSLWFGLLCENIVQALARIVVFDQMMELEKKYPVVMTVHDEVVLCVPEEQAEEAKTDMEQIMSTPPAWAKSLPVACEVNVAKRYGDAK